MRAWEFKGYTVFEETDVLRFENLVGDVIGYVSNVQENNLIEDLENGATPIEGQWEDGVGNTLEITGWGEQEPQDIETMYERLRAALNVDGEDERYMTLFASEEELKEEKDVERFESEFSVKVNELSYPVVVLDHNSSVGGYVFNKDETHDLKDEALEYFTKK